MQDTYLKIRKHTEGINIRRKKSEMCLTSVKGKHYGSNATHRKHTVAKDQALDGSHLMNIVNSFIPYAPDHI